MKPARLPALATLAGICLALAACRQPIPADYAQYAGHWRGDGVLLVLSPNGQADYQHVRDGSRTRIQGPVHSFDAQGFSVGLGLLSARFEVQQPPQFSNGRWRMTVDDQDLVRVEILPVRSDRGSYSL